MISTTDNRLEYITRKPGRFRHVSVRGVGGEATYRAIPRNPDVLVRDAAVVETYDGSLQLFSNSFGIVWTTKQQGRNGDWMGWTSLGGMNPYQMPPAVSRGPDEALRLFVTGRDGAMWTKSQQGRDGAWTPWTSLGGKNLYTSPSVGRGVNDRLEVTAAASDGAVWKVGQTSGGGFGSWEQFSDPKFTTAATDPQMITRSDRSLEIVVRRVDGTIATRRQNKPGGPWGAWSAVVGHAGVGQPAVILEPSGMLTILSAGSDDRLYQGRFGVDPATGMRTAVEGWQDFTREGAPLVGASDDINGAGMADGSWVVAYLDPDEAMAEITSGGAEAFETPAAQARTTLRDLASVRREDGSSGKYAEWNGTANAQMGSAGWTPPPFLYDHFTFDDCKDTAGNPEKPGTTRNHYSYCWAGTAAIHYKTNCWFGGRICVGRRVVYTATIIGEGSTHLREALYRVHLSNFEDVTPADSVMRIKAELNCDALVNPDDCTVDGSTRSVERTIAEWWSNSEARMKAVGGEPARTKENPDALGYGNAWVRVTATAPDNSKREIKSPKNRIRFDSAEYLKYTAYTGDKGAIFPDVNAVLHFPINTPAFAAMRESGLHYKQAMERPEETTPKWTGKTIPGAIGGAPLHRLYYDQKWRDENGAEAKRTCQTELPPGEYPKPGYDCDEYPFKTTREGASPLTNPLRRFSVKSIPADDNQAAGTWLSAWYSYDRIVDGDPFYVRVIE